MERITEETALKLLDLFVYREDDGLRDEIRQPYLKDGRICATDTYSLIRISRDYFPNETFQQVKSYNIKWPAQKLPVKLPLSMISRAIEQLPMVDVCIEEDETAACPECDGSGEVEWEYEDLSGETYYHTFECPVCDGIGTVERTINKPTGEKERDKEYFVKIGDFYCIKSRNLLLLYEAMKLCGAEEVAITGSTDYLISFNIAEGIDMLAVNNANIENRSYIEIVL